MEELRENYEHVLTGCKVLHLNFCLTSENKEERPERCREECKFVVIKSDLFELRIAMFILPTVVEGSFR